VAAPPFSGVLVGVSVAAGMNSCAHFVCLGRKSRAGAEQRGGPELRARIGIDLSLHANDGTAVGIETANRNDDLAAELSCAAIARSDEGCATGNLEDGLRAVETVR
jgi:hypothetical protein